MRVFILTIYVEFMGEMSSKNQNNSRMQKKNVKKNIGSGPSCWNVLFY